MHVPCRLSNVIFHKGLGWRANFGSIHAREAQAIVVQKAAEAAEQAAAAEMAAADGITDWAAFAQELDKLQGAGAGGDLEEGGHMLSSVTGGEPAPSSTAAAGTGTGTGAGAAGAAAGDSTGSTAASGAAGATPAAAAAAGAGAAKAPAARREALGMGSARSMLSQKHMKKQLIRLAERNTLDTGLYQVSGRQLPWLVVVGCGDWDASHGISYGKLMAHGFLEDTDTRS